VNAVAVLQSHLNFAEILGNGMVMSTVATAPLQARRSESMTFRREKRATPSLGGHAHAVDGKTSNRSSRASGRLTTINLTDAKHFARLWRSLGLGTGPKDPMFLSVPGVCV
jgi:hypothetical protein